MTQFAAARPPALVINVNQAQLDEAQRLLDGLHIRGGMRRAIVRALNRVAERTKGRVARELRRLIANEKLQLSGIRGSIRVIKARLGHGTHSGDGVARIRIYGRGLPLLKLGARQTAEGVAFWPAAGRRELLRHAFIAVMPKGGRKGVFLRRGRSRLPIVEQRGPSLASLFVGTPDLVARTHAEAMADLDREIIQQVRVEIDRHAAAHPYSRVAAMRTAAMATGG